MTPSVLILLAVVSLHPMLAPSGHVQESATQKTWMNDDIPWLEANVPITTFQPVAVTEAAALPPAGPYVKEKDPEWYRKEISSRQDAIDADKAQIRALQLAGESGAGASGTISLVNHMTIDADATIANLQTQIKSMTDAINDLEDLARKNSIEPGAIR
jgi:hypothetical protein